MSRSLREQSTLKSSRKWSLRLNAFIRWTHIYVSMGGFLAMLFFSFTGITLNHPMWFGGETGRSTTENGKLPLEWVINTIARLDKPALEASASEPMLDKLMISERLRERHRLRGRVTEFRVDDEECLVTFKGPGYSADVFVDRVTGSYEISIVEHGLIGKWNDLHKGRDSGFAWSIVIDVSAAVMIVSSVTGLAMLLFLKRKRRTGFITLGVGAIVFAAFYLFMLP